MTLEVQLVYQQANGFTFSNVPRVDKNFNIYYYVALISKKKKIPLNLYINLSFIKNSFTKTLHKWEFDAYKIIRKRVLWLVLHSNNEHEVFKECWFFYETA